MNGKTVSEFIPRKAEQVVLMSSNPSGKEDKNRLVDPALMFHRLVGVAKRSEKEESFYCKYELCSYPTSLFDDHVLLRNADKAELAKAISTMTTYDPINSITTNARITHSFVLDGLAIINLIPWSKNETYV